MGWQWHQLNHMQAICTLLQKITTPAAHESDFYGPNALPDTQPTASKHWRLNQRTKPHVSLVLGNNILTQVNNVRDVGVIVDNHLKFDVHINQTVTCAHRLANLIHKSFVSKDPPTLVHAFTAYVRSLLEYASCVWSPYTVGLVNKVESVQRTFTKHSVCCYGLTYSQWLTKLGVERLELRRLHLDLVYVNKILFSVVDTEVSAHFVMNNTDSSTRGYSLNYLLITRVLTPVNIFSVIELYDVGIVCLLHLPTFLP